MSFTTAAIFTVKENRKLLQFSARYKRHEPVRTSQLRRLGPKQGLSQAGERRVRRQQLENLIRDLVLLAVSMGVTFWLLSLFV